MFLVPEFFLYSPSDVGVCCTDQTTTGSLQVGIWFIGNGLDWMDRRFGVSVFVGGDDFGCVVPSGLGLDIVKGV